MDTPAAVRLSKVLICASLAGLSLFCLLLSPAHVQGADWLKNLLGNSSSGRNAEPVRSADSQAVPPELEYDAGTGLAGLPRPGSFELVKLQPQSLRDEQSGFQYQYPDQFIPLDFDGGSKRNSGLRAASFAQRAWAGALFASLPMPADVSQTVAGASGIYREYEEAGLRHVWRGTPRELEIWGVPALEYELTGIHQQPTGPVVSFRHCIVILKDGVVYHFSAIGLQTLRAAVATTNRQQVQRFQLLDGTDFETSIFPVRLADWASVPERAFAVRQAVRTNIATSEECSLQFNGENGEIVELTTFSLAGHSIKRDVLVSSLLHLLPNGQVNSPTTTILIGDNEWVEQRRPMPNTIFNTSDLVFRVLVRNQTAVLVSSLYPKAIGVEEHCRWLDEFLRALDLGNDLEPSTNHLTMRSRAKHARLFDKIGELHLANEQLDSALRCFRTAQRFDPGNALIASHLLAVLSRLGRYEEASNLLNNPPSEIAASDFWQSERASMLAITGHTDDSVVVFERLFESGARNDESFEAYLATLARAGRIEEAIAAADRYLTNGDSRSISLVRSRMLILAGKYDEAITAAKSQLSNAQADPTASYILVEAYRDSGRQEQAHQVISRLLEDGFDDARTWFLKATVEIEEERYQAARTSLETVLQRQPDHPQVHDTLEMVSSLMGQSDNTEIRSRIEAVPLPEQVQAAVARSPGNRNASAWYGLAAVAHSFNPGREYRRTSYGVVHLEDAAAVSEFSTLQFAFNPLSERVFVNRVEVFDRNGRLLAKGSIDDYYVQTDSTQDLATEERVVNVPVPGLKSGCRLEYVFTSERPGGPDRFPFTQHCFSRGKPVERAVLHIRGDVSGLTVQGSISPQKSADGLTWIVNAPPKLTDEPLQIDRQKAYPTVTIAGADATWLELAERYTERFADRLNISPGVRDLAETITTDAKAVTLAEKVVAVAGFVQQELVYQGLEFGVRGQVMPPVQQTLQRRYGDCKDHSLLLYQLLRAVDVPASLCLVQSSGPVVSEIPSMEQFDHMIVFVEDGKDGWFIDATSKGYSPEFRVPPSLAKHDALILDGASSRLVQIPDYPAGVSQIFADRLVQLDADGQALVTEVVQIKGYSAAVYRSLIRDIDLSHRNDFIRDYLAPEKSDTKPLTGSVQNLDDPNQPLVLKATYRVRELLHPTYGLLVGRLPQFLESGMVEYEEIEERQTPFRLRYPTDVIARVRLELPPGYTVDGSPADVSQASPFGGLASRVTVTDGQFEILSRLTRRTGEYSASQWTDYARFLSLAGETFAPRLLLREGPVQQASRETAPAAAGR